MWGVTGHDKIISHLENSVVNSSLAHSFLITGIDGVGKKELAVALARRLFCQSDEPPCNSCNVCRKIYDTSVRDDGFELTVTVFAPATVTYIYGDSSKQVAVHNTKLLVFAFSSRLP